MQFQSLPYTPLRITSRYGPRNTGIAGASTLHRGIDLGRNFSLYPGNVDGGPVMSVLPGTVSTSTYNSARGYYVIVDHGTIEGRNVKTLYQHLVRQGLAVGTTVKAGDVIGRMGASGTASAVHLHFELHFNNQPVDPEPYLYDIEEVQEEQELIYRTLAEVPEWARPAIERGVANRWIAVDDVGNFSVYKSNLQTAAWFYSAGLWDRVRPSSSEPSSWAREAVTKAQDAGIIVGNTQGDLLLHSPITREETLVFLDRVGVIPETDMD